MLHINYISIRLERKEAFNPIYIIYRVIDSFIKKKKKDQFSKEMNKAQSQKFLKCKQIMYYEIKNVSIL